ncbi:helicase associated domain-containing protein [Streptomyces nojiriensis]|uniref:helicase associated domain-containing protein n=1 Tax=Streptomyces nojiriensis TaxID=66374 RepID=UPI00399A92A1
MGPAHDRAAVDVRAGSRDRARDRGREAAAAPHASRQVGDELRGRQAVLRAEGHLQVPRKHVERIVGEDQEEREHKLGAWIGNQRSRAATLTSERMEQLSAIGMRWS